MPAPKGNQFWKQRSKHGKEKIFSGPDMLWKACREYFEWVDNNPWYEDYVYVYQGRAKHEPAAKKIPYTLSGLCVFLGITIQTWQNYKQYEGYLEVIEKVENIIQTEKYQGAAIGMYHPKIIARDIGLVERQEHTGKDGAPISSNIKVEFVEPK